MKSETAKAYIQNLTNQALGKLGFNLSKPDFSYPDPSFGDYATNAALVLAKREKQNPKELAGRLAAAIVELDKDKNLEISEAAGFINFKLSQKFLFQNLQSIIEKGDLYGASINGKGKSVMVEYFQNNVAKPPHVGHLRSAVIGDCLLRILRSQGYKAISDTHIGDWGTQFGILLYAFKTLGKKKQVEKNAIDELNKLYMEMSKKIEENPELREKAKEEFAKLEKGDMENRELWQWFVRESLEDFEKFRKLLDVLPFDHNLGESFYEDKMQDIVSDLKLKGLLVESEGAQIVNLENKKLGVAVLVKSDGATTYLLRDLATIKYRINQLKVSKAIYVVDNRQAHHFHQAFGIALQAGYIKEKDVVEHVDFGFMSLPEGAISTRKGNIISLQNLISEAEKRAEAIIEEKNPKLKKKKAVAGQVARAAIKYFDLAHNRKTEFVFTWDKALSFDGNTGPYMQYTNARIHGILRKVTSLNPSYDKEGNGLIPLLSKERLGEVNSHELLVLRKLNQFPEILEQVARDYMPNLLCNYLFELSQSFNSFYQEIPVLQEKDEQLRSFRLNLITATAQVIKNGLNLLGIEAPEEM